jgi:hypothetical protein
MSSMTWLLIIVGALTLLGSCALFFTTVKYYWGERGRPPLTGVERRRQKEMELELRRKQLEYAQKHPIKPRSPNFLDNRKQK